MRVLVQLKWHCRHMRGLNCCWYATRWAIILRFHALNRPQALSLRVQLSGSVWQWIRCSHHCNTALLFCRYMPMSDAVLALYGMYGLLLNKYKKQVNLKLIIFTHIM